LLGLIVNGSSVRAGAECLALGFGPDSPSKSTVATRANEASAAARELFAAYFSGQGEVAACDEVYVSGHSVLEMVEPRSLAIVGLKPDTAPSAVAWKALLAEFDHLEAAVSDEGQGLRAAIVEQLQRQGRDQWHLTRHLGAAVGRLESAAYAAIEYEQRCRDRFVKALPCSPGPVPPALLRLERAEQAMEKAIAVYDQAHTVQVWLSEAADAVDGHGRVRTPEQVASDWETALDLGEQIETGQLKTALGKLRGKRDGAHVKGLSERMAGVALPAGFAAVERERLQALACRAWRYHHRRQTHLLRAPVEAADWMAAQLGMPFVARHLVAYAGTVFKLLDRTLKASSSVECVNSIFRLGQGAKRHPNSDFMYLLAWIHNTRQFKEGRRKGLSPAELMGIQLPKDGWSMLLERMRSRAAKKARLN